MRVFAVAAAFAVSATLGVGAYAASTQQSATTTVTVTMTEFAFKLSKRTVPKGTVVFKVVNKGTVKHDFKIAGKKTRQLARNQTQTLRVVFTKAGRYTAVCTVPGHLAAGMKTVLTVR
jgi:nitrite reductase (NO-forming)